MTRSDNRRSLVGVWGLGLALFFSTVFLGTLSDQVRTMVGEEGRLLYIPSAEVLHLVSLGEDLTAADLLYLRGVFYIAETNIHDIFEEHLHHGVKESEESDPIADSIAAANLNFRDHSLMRYLFFWNEGSDLGKDLYPLLERVSDLDPRFEPAYTSGALMLAMFYGRPEEALKLAQKGVQNLPQSWSPLYYRGFLKLFYFGDKEGSADDFIQAALKPDAPEFLIHLAQTLQVKLKGEDLAIRYLESMAYSIED
ncbi:MAG: tetratricopeptide repeat protein, partial [bacterium]